MDSLLTGTQSSEITKTITRLRDVMNVASKDVGVRLVIRKGRVVGVCFTLQMTPGRASYIDLLDELAALVAGVGDGYGEAEAILNGSGEVESCQIVVSLGLKSF